MKYKIDGVDLNYRVSGAGRPVVLLHGWGGSHKSFAPVENHLAEHFTVYNIDLPGFGESSEPPEPWDTEQYANLIANFFVEKNIKKPIILAHSFGGRLTLHLGAKGIPYKIIITGGAGLKPKRSFKYYLKVYSYKLVKNILLLPGIRSFGKNILEKWQKNKGSEDYRNASPIMKEVLKKSVNEDRAYLLPKITAPTLLVWGENDTATPLAFGEQMEREIPGAGLAVIQNAGHFAYLEQLNQFLAIIDVFLKPDWGVEEASKASN